MWLGDDRPQEMKACATGSALRPDCFTGVAVGQSHDPSALAVVEWAEEAGEWDAATWAYKKTTSLRLRHLERAPLGTPYPEVVERAREVACSEAVEGRRHLVVD